MAAVRVYLDEDVHRFIADAIRLRGWDALTTVEAGRLSTSDAEQLRFATDHGYSILTYNVQDFPRLHYEVLARGDNHAGIIVAGQHDPRRNVRALLNLLSRASAEQMRDNLVYVSNWD